MKGIKEGEYGGYTFILIGNRTMKPVVIIK
jgi:hypothetical protein